MSKSQDYMAKVRYQNDLPPPLLPPKLLKYNGRAEEDVRSASLLSSLFRKQNVNNIITLDNDLGLPIDLSGVPALFYDEGQEKDAVAAAPLHPADRVLLRDPQVSRTVKAQPAVAFLRRTEYIGSTKMNTGSTQTSRSATPAQSTLEDDSPASLLHSIESTFESATKTLKDTSSLRHPLKKSLKAKKVWSLLPDISRMDQKFTTIKFAPNSVSNVSEVEYRTAIYRKLKLDDLDWLSFYTTDKESAKVVKRSLDDLNENIPKDVEDGAERFKYSRRSDFEAKTAHISDDNQEIALRFDQDKGIVYYNQISDKVDLKRRKIQETHRDLLEASELDEVDVRIREPTAAELNKRNTLRHKHDAVTYEATEFRDDEEEEEEEEEEDDLDDLRKARAGSQ